MFIPVIPFQLTGNCATKISWTGFGWHKSVQCCLLTILHTAQSASCPLVEIPDTPPRWMEKCQSCSAMERPEPCPGAPLQRDNFVKEKPGKTWKCALETSNEKSFRCIRALKFIPAAPFCCLHCPSPKIWASSECSELVRAEATLEYGAEMCFLFVAGPKKRGLCHCASILAGPKPQEPS